MTRQQIEHCEYCVLQYIEQISQTILFDHPSAKLKPRKSNEEIVLFFRHAYETITQQIRETLHDLVEISYGAGGVYDSTEDSEDPFNAKNIDQTVAMLFSEQYRNNTLLNSVLRLLFQTMAQQAHFYRTINNSLQSSIYLHLHGVQVKRSYVSIDQVNSKIPEVNKLLTRLFMVESGLQNLSLLLYAEENESAMTQKDMKNFLEHAVKKIRKLAQTAEESLSGIGTVTHWRVKARQFLTQEHPKLHYSKLHFLSEKYKDEVRQFLNEVVPEGSQKLTIIKEVLRKPKKSKGEPLQLFNISKGDVD